MPAEGLLVVRLSPGFRTADIAAYLRRSREVAEAGCYAAIVSCERRMPIVPPRYAAMQAAWIHEHYELIARNCGGIALVLPSPFMRGALRAVLSMAPMPCEVQEFETEPEALAWTTRQLAGKRSSQFGPSWRSSPQSSAHSGKSND
jgi:hypothetical protein